MKKSGNVVFKSCHGRESVYDIRYLENGKLKPLLVFCHGFKGFKDWGHFNLIADDFCNSGMIVLKFNFTFNGGTAEDPIDFPDLNSFAKNNYLKEIEDIHHLIQKVKEGSIPVSNWDGKIYLLGHSRGGGMVTIAGYENNKVSKVVSWAGISDCISRLPNPDELLEWESEGFRFIVNGRTHQNMPMDYQFVETLLENKNRLSIENASRNIGKPHLIVHGTGDKSVEINHAKLINSWSPDSQIEIIQGANHVFGGKHPWNDNHLPQHTNEAIKITLSFLSE
jgi:dienelactone hydrolase